MAIQQDITLADVFFLGENKTIAFDLTNDLGVPASATGWTLEFRVYRPLSTTGAVVLRSTGTGITLTDAQITGDRILVQFEPITTAEQLPGTYRYELRRVDVGEDAVLAFGTLALQTPRA